MNPQTGKLLVLIGLLLVLGGILVYFFYDKLQWLGNLPGDIRLKGDNYRIFIPITTMLILSLLISIVLYFIRRFF
jgi:uncharacterized protein HemY